MKYIQYTFIYIYVYRIASLHKCAISGVAHAVRTRKRTRFKMKNVQRTRISYASAPFFVTKALFRSFRSPFHSCSQNIHSKHRLNPRSKIRRTIRSARCLLRHCERSLLPVRSSVANFSSNHSVSLFFVCISSQTTRYKNGTYPFRTTMETNTRYHSENFSTYFFGTDYKK